MQGRLKIVELAERMAREKRTLRMSTHAQAHMPG
jgi:hypothetical protein